jgi:hypothetical protein
VRLPCTAHGDGRKRALYHRVRDEVGLRVCVHPAAAAICERCMSLALPRRQSTPLCTAWRPAYMIARGGGGDGGLLCVLCAHP